MSLPTSKAASAGDRTPPMAPHGGAKEFADNSSNILQQLTTDLQQYEQKTRSFLKSILQSNRQPQDLTQANDTDTSLLSSRNHRRRRHRARDDEDEDDEVRTLDNSSTLSNESQNLKGFESQVDDDEQLEEEDLDGDEVRRKDGHGSDIYSDDDEGLDGEECSSSGSQSDAFKAYRSKRMAMIMGSGGYSSAAVGSSDGEGIVPHRSNSAGGLRKRNSSISRSSEPGAPNLRQSQDPSVPWDLRDKVVMLEKALRDAKLNHSGSPTSAPSSASPSPKKHSTSTHFDFLDRARLTAVLRVAKGDFDRAVALASRYSTLRDILGLALTCPEDVADWLKCGAVHVTLAGGREPNITRDKTSLLYIVAKSLPSVPTTERARKEYTVQLVRCILYLIEKERFSLKPSVGSPSKGELSAATVPEAAAIPAGVKGAKKVKGTQQRTVAGDGRCAETLTVVFDVSDCESSRLSALASIFGQCDELLSQHYPMQISRLIAYLPGKAQQPPATVVDGKDSAKKGPVAMFKSLFKSNKDKRPKQTTTGGPSDDEPVAEKAPSLATKLWLSVMVSTWKLRFLHPTVRSRTVVLDSLEGYLDLDALKTLLSQSSLP